MQNNRQPREPEFNGKVYHLFLWFLFGPHQNLAVFHLNYHTNPCFLIHSSSAFISRHKINHTKKTSSNSNTTLKSRESQTLW